MNRINLPSYATKLRENGSRQEIFDFLRRKYVTLTPEEWVRQHFTHLLTDHLGYPKGLLANEVELKVGTKRLRCDTLLYNRGMQPQMIIEYKAPDIAITQHVFNQITAYNMLLHVDWLIVSNGMQHFCCRMDYERQSYSFLSEIPRYEELEVRS